MNKTLKVIDVKIENFKNLKSLDVTPDGHSVYLVGKNRVGKTSVIQAIWGALSQKAMPETPLSKGKTTGSVIVVIGNDKEKYTIKRVLSEDSVSLEIQNADGFKTTQVKVLKELIGDIDFDIEHFIELSKTIPGKREQIEIVKSMLDPEVVSNLQKFEHEKKMVTETKSENNILLRDRNGYIRSIKDLEMEDAPIDTELIRKDLAIQRKYQTERINIKNSISHLEELRSAAKEAIRKAEKTIKDCEKEDAVLQEELGELPEFDSTEELEKQLSGAEGHNAKYKRFQDHQKANADAMQYSEVIAQCTERLKNIELEVKKIIAESEFPVKELEITENGLLYKGLPFDESALSTSELMEVGVKLAIAQNPNMKILRMPQAESLDPERMDAIVKSAEKHGYQLFIERVTADEKLMVRIIE